MLLRTRTRTQPYPLPKVAVHGSQQFLQLNLRVMYGRAGASPEVRFPCIRCRAAVLNVVPSVLVRVVDQTEVGRLEASFDLAAGFGHSTTPEWCGEQAVRRVRVCRVRV